MTKKFLFGTMAAVTMMFASSCSNEIDVVTPTGNESTLAISLDIPQKQMGSRAFGDGTTATKLQYAVYEKTGAGLSQIEALKGNGDMENLKKTINLKLLNGHTYAFVFWAASENAPYEVTFEADGAKMEADYSAEDSNNEDLDAFYAYYEHTVTGDQAVDVPLYRPFAQINIGANDIDDVEKVNYDVKQSTVTITGGVYSTLDLVTGEVSDPIEEAVTFNLADIPDNTKETFPVATYEYVAMNYILVDKVQALTEVNFTVTYTNESSEDKEVKRTVGSVPVQRNFRTNIYGQLFTNNVDLNVIIEPDFEKPDYEVIALADGVRFIPETNTFEISNAAGLQWVAYQVNNFGGNEYVKAQKFTYGAANVAFVDQTIELTDDIDLQNIDWTPIGYETKENGASLYGFAGIFDGKDHTISNLTVSTEENSNAGLFGATNRATIKNVTLKNVDIKGHYKAGAIVGDGYNARIENCNVEGGEITITPWEKTPGVYDDANNVGGIVGYLIGQPEDAYAKNCKVNGLEITAFRKVGGIAGIATCADDKKPHECYVEISECTVENTKITADMTEVRYDGFISKVPDIGTIYGKKEGQGTINVQDNSTESAGTVTIVVKEAKKVGGAEAVTAIKDGGNVFLTDSANSDNGYTLTKETNINLNNNSLSAKSNGSYGDNIVVGNGANVTISNGEIKPADDASVANSSATILIKTASESHLTLNNVKATGIHPVYLNSANENTTVTINGGEYYTTMPLEGVSSDQMAPAVYVGKGATGSTVGGKVTINGGTFGSKGVVNNFLLNVEDVLRKQDGKEPRNFIEVFGGKFYNFNPANNKAEGEGTNFVADGYKVISYADGDDTIYEVVAE